MNILIVDDHALFREGLRHVLGGLDECSGVLEAARCDEAFAMVADNPAIGLVLLDIDLPDMDGCTALHRLSLDFPDLPVVLLTASESVQDMRRGFDAGASGYIHKSASAGMMLGALQLVLAGGIYIPPSLVGLERQDPQPGRRATHHPARGDVSLTSRQRDVLRLLRDGLSNKQIAARMGLAEATVKAHISAILKTLGVHTRTEAALRAQALSGQD